MLFVSKKYDFGIFEKEKEGLKYEKMLILEADLETIILINKAKETGIYTIVTDYETLLLMCKRLGMTV